jgi:transposase
LLVGSRMGKPLVSDALWAQMQPLLPPDPPRPTGGRPRLPDRAVLGGILFVLRTGIPWEYLPAQMRGGSGKTCSRRLRDWQRTGVRWSGMRRAPIFTRLFSSSAAPLYPSRLCRSGPGSRARRLPFVDPLVVV